MTLLCFTTRISQSKQTSRNAVLVHFGEGEVDRIDLVTGFFGNVFEHVARGHRQIVRALVLDAALQILIDGLLVAERKSDHEINRANAFGIRHEKPFAGFRASIVRAFAS